MCVDKVNFVDTTFRDGHASLWAERMKTSAMLPVAEDVDGIGFSAVEVMGTSHFKKCVRELREDPWDRIRLLAERMPNTVLAAMMSLSVNTFSISPLAIMKLFIERLAANGIRRVQVMPALNNMQFRIPDIIGFARECGLEVAVAIVYSHSSIHTDAYYSVKAEEAAALPVDAIYLKDPGGLLTPERTRTLVPAIMENIRELPLEIHSHCTTGLAPLCYLEAIKCGVRTVHTAIPPLANGSSQPSVVNIAENVRSMGLVPDIDEGQVASIFAHFDFIAESEQLPVGAPLEYDLRQYVHQVPGGVISNLNHQLSQVGMGNRLEEVLEEVVRVRADLGHPIMVTPFSQFVVSQAAMNVMLGERYQEISDEVVKYSSGFWGEDVIDRIDPDLMDMIAAQPKAKEIGQWEYSEPTVTEMRAKWGGPGVSDEELLLRYIVEEEEVRKMRDEYYNNSAVSSDSPVVNLISGLAKQKDVRYVRLQNGGDSFLSIDYR